jgi:hypothetical protein
MTKFPNQTKQGIFSQGIGKLVNASRENSASDFVSETYGANASGTDAGPAQRCDGVE